jgi:hypothetical protein
MLSVVLLRQLGERISAFDAAMLRLLETAAPDIGAIAAKIG